MNKISKYKANNFNINNLSLLIEMGIDKYIDKDDMIIFSQSILNKVQKEKYNYCRFKIRIILINQFDNYIFYLN